MAAPILSFEGLGVRAPSGGWLFEGVDIHVGARDRLALIGRNGAGKTTLLKTVAGLIEPDAGRRTLVAGTRVVMLEQHPPAVGATLRDGALAGEDAPAPHALAAAADRIGIDLNRATASASGGERRHAAIARAIAMDPDILLLDEPTNHLDLTAIGWLEDWLAGFKGAFVVISHDRAFLRRLTRASLWLDRGTLRRAEVGFGGFDAWTESVALEDARAADRLDARLKLELHWLQRGVTARRKRNQGRLAKLGEMRAARAAMLGPQGVARLGVASDSMRSKVVIDARRVTKCFGDRTIVRDFSFRVARGDRIGVVGANGVGKTTLLRLLTGELAPDEGEVVRARGLDMILIDQQRQRLDPEKSVRDVLADGGDWIDVRGTRTHVAGYLKDYLFDPALVDAPVGTLSGGERSRLLFAREFARTASLLVLDEPTNDLDLETLDLLQEVIADYPGTVLIVSHDRDFLDRTVTVTLGLDGTGRVDIVAGGYEDWQRARAAAPVRSTTPKALPAKPSAPRASAKLSYKDQRDLDRLPAEIERLSAMIARDEAALGDAGLYTRDPARFASLTAAIDAARAEREAAEARWLEVALLAEEIA